MFGNDFRKLKALVKVADQASTADLSRFSLLLKLVALKNLIRTGGFSTLFGEPQPVSISADELASRAQMLYEAANGFCSLTVENAVPPPSRSIHVGELWRLIGDELAIDHYTIGYLYQVWCRPQRRISQRTIESADKRIDAGSLIAFTQIYTPPEVVRRLTAACITARPAGPTFAVLDPACGSGHFLVEAFDSLVGAMPCIARAGHGPAPTVCKPMSDCNCAESASQAVQHSLFGTDIDPVAVWIASLNLLLKLAAVGVRPDFRCENVVLVDAGEDLLGSLNRNFAGSHPLGKRYDAVITNPPYIGRKLIDRALKSALAKLYPDAAYDLCAAFICRALEMLKPGGRIGFIAQSALLHLPTYRALRERLSVENELVSTVELGPGVFPLTSGEKINSCLIVAARPVANGKDTGKQSVERTGAVRSQFTGYTGKTLADIAEVRQGLATTRNVTFVRNWWDVDPEQMRRRWFPYAKGAGSELWFTPIRHVVDWENDGQRIKRRVAEVYPYLNGKTAWVVKNEQFYFRAGLNFSFVNSRRLAIRELPSGCIFDVACSGIFADPDQLAVLLAYLNSSPVNAIAKRINPTINFQVGDLKRLPVPEFTGELKTTLSELAVKAAGSKRQLCDLDITALEWQPPEEIRRLLDGGSLAEETENLQRRFVAAVKSLNEAEAAIDEVVSDVIPECFESTSSANRFVPPSEQDVLFCAVYAALLKELGEPVTIAPPCLPLTNELCARAGVETQAYLAGPFMKLQLSRLRKSPYFFTQHVAGKTGLFSQQHIRSGCNGSLSPLREALANISDWTGKDVLAAL